MVQLTIQIKQTPEQEASGRARSSHGERPSSTPLLLRVLVLVCRKKVILRRPLRRQDKKEWTLEHARPLAAIVHSTLLNGSRARTRTLSVGRAPKGGRGRVRTPTRLLAAAAKERAKRERLLSRVSIFVAEFPTFGIYNYCFGHLIGILCEQYRIWV